MGQEPLGTTDGGLEKPGVVEGIQCNNVFQTQQGSYLYDIAVMTARNTCLKVQGISLIMIIVVPIS